MLDSGFSLFPEGVKTWFPYFIKSNWLETYTSLHGLSMVFKRMSYRTSLPDHSDYAVKQLQDHYDVLSRDFREFFRDMIAYVNTEFGITIHRNSA
jgi:acyl carrier protein phosphodiesterase